MILCLGQYTFEGSGSHCARSWCKEKKENHIEHDGDLYCPPYRRCCNCRNSTGYITIRCLGCLNRPVQLESGVEDGSPPKEFKSISLRNLKLLLQCLGETMSASSAEVNSYWIRNHLRGFEEEVGTTIIIVPKIKHPAKQFPDLFSVEDPDVAVTYTWKTGLSEENGLLSLAKGQDENLKIWLDVLFIDQLSTNIPMNLAKAQEVYGLSPQHWVFGTNELLTRGWCLFELCLRASQKNRSLILGDLGDKVKKVGHNFFTNMVLWDPQDKTAIETTLKNLHGWHDGYEERINRVIVDQITTGSPANSSSTNLGSQSGAFSLVLEGSPVDASSTMARYPVEPSSTMVGVSAKPSLKTTASPANASLTMADCPAEASSTMAESPAESTMAGFQVRSGAVQQESINQVIMDQINGKAVKPSSCCRLM